MTATRRRATDPDHRLLSIEARGGQVTVTAHHHMMDSEQRMVRADGLDAGDKIAVTERFPLPAAWTAVTNELAEVLGLMCADGYVARDGSQICFTNNDDRARARVAELWSRCFLHTSREWTGRSGFSEDVGVGKLNLVGGHSVAPWLREQLYTKTAHKQ